MNLEFDFGLSPWEEALENMKSGGSLSAVRFLTLMEGEEEPAVEDALRYLEENKILLELSDLPKPEGTGEAAVRLKLEEKLVQEGMDALMKGRTVFVIAHRLSTVMNSDCIMVLDHGHIIERGTHEDLIAQKGTYYQLYTGAFELE